MRRNRPVLQTACDVKPTKSVFVENKRTIACDCVQSALIALRSETRFLVWHKIGIIAAGPFTLRSVPPDELLALAPRLSIGCSAGAVVNDAPIARPGEAPAMPQITARVARVRLVDFIRPEYAGVNPAAARGGAVGFQFRVAIDLRSVVRFAVAIGAKHNAVIGECGRGLSAPICLFVATLRSLPHFQSVPAVDLGQHCFYARPAGFVLRS